MQASSKTNTPRLARAQLKTVGRIPSFPTADRAPPRWSQNSSNFIDEKKVQMDKLDLELFDVELQDLPPPDVDTTPKQSKQPKERDACGCSILKITAILSTVLIIWAGWFAYLFFYALTDIWPVPRVWMNTQNGAATGVGVVFFIAAAVVSAWLLTLLQPLSFGCLGIRSTSKGISIAAYSVFSIIIMICVSIGLMYMWKATDVCGGETPYPIFITGYSSSDGAYAAVYDNDRPGSWLVEEYVVAQDPATSSVQLSLLNGPSDAPEPQVSYDMPSGVATSPALNTTANFAPDSVGPVFFPALNTSFEAVEGTTTGVYDFSLIQSSSQGRSGVVFKGATQSPISCATIKICSAHIPSQTKQLLVPLGLAMFYQFQNSWTC